jgi:perosamine synthetase
MTLIRVSEPLLTDEDRASVAGALSRSEISSSGEAVALFERAWAAACGRRHGVAVANGTVALELAVACLNLKPGDEVILPTFTIISCALAVLRAGAVPRFVDADRETWTLDVDAVAAALGPKTRAIMPVHIYGHPANMARIEEIASLYGVSVVEDAAEAHGAECLSASGHWQLCGSFGDVSCFSFYANKLITTGEGGMLVTDDDRIAERARLLRNLAFGQGRRFSHDDLGFNFRMTALQAALGLPQVARLGDIVKQKRHIADAYTARLQDVPGLQLPTEQPWARSVYWMYGVVIDEVRGHDAQAVASRLAAHGVETRPFFLGMHAQPVLNQRGVARTGSFPVADRLARQGLYLPSGLGLTDDQIGYVSDALAESLT